MAIVLTWPVGRDGEGASGSTPPPVSPVAVYVLATTLGGAATGVVIGAIGAGLASVTSLHLVAAWALAVAAVAVALQSRGCVAPLPERRAQVPRRWVFWRSRELSAAAFGLMIGSGALTRVQHAAAYVLAAAVLLAPSIALAAAAGALYGLGRGATLGATWIGDRFVGGRPPWSRLLTPTRRLHTVLALAAALFTSAASSVVPRLLEV
jgi:hypothetical protein